MMAYSDEALWSDEGLLFLKEFGEAAEQLNYDGGALGRHHSEDGSPMPGLIEVEQPYEMPPDPAELRERVLKTTSSRA